MSRSEVGRLLGIDHAPFVGPENTCAEVGFWIQANARGRGVGSAALRLMLDWAFNDLGLERIEMTALPENTSVPHIAAKFGFTYEGCLRQRNYERGRRVDLLIWGLLKDEAKR
jgi:ribosomal-protein-serine acetyltransferase